jgi:hypothetical protein
MTREVEKGPPVTEGRRREAREERMGVKGCITGKTQASPSAYSFSLGTFAALAAEMGNRSTRIGAACALVIGKTGDRQRILMERERRLEAETGRGVGGTQDAVYRERRFDEVERCSGRCSRRCIEECMDDEQRTV